MEWRPGAQILTLATPFVTPIRRNMSLWATGTTPILFSKTSRDMANIIHLYLFSGGRLVTEMTKDLIRTKKIDPCITLPTQTLQGLIAGSIEKDQEGSACQVFLSSPVNPTLTHLTLWL